MKRRKQSRTESSRAEQKAEKITDKADANAIMQSRTECRAERIAERAEC